MSDCTCSRKGCLKGSLKSLKFKAPSFGGNLAKARQKNLSSLKPKSLSACLHTPGADIFTGVSKCQWVLRFIFYIILDNIRYTWGSYGWFPLKLWAGNLSEAGWPTPHVHDWELRPRMPLEQRSIRHEQIATHIHHDDDRQMIHSQHILGWSAASRFAKRVDALRKGHKQPTSNEQFDDEQQNWPTYPEDPWSKLNMVM